MAPTPAPDVSVDGLALFFGHEYGVWVATRESPDRPFSMLDAVIEGLADAPASSWNCPALSDDCRSLDAVRYVSDTGAGNPPGRSKSNALMPRAGGRVDISLSLS